jgi:hypothetical protein
VTTFYPLENTEEGRQGGQSSAAGDVWRRGIDPPGLSASEQEETVFNFPIFFLKNQEVVCCDESTHWMYFYL